MSISHIYRMIKHHHHKFLLYSIILLCLISACGISSTYYYHLHSEITHYRPVQPIDLSKDRQHNDPGHHDVNLITTRKDRPKLKNAKSVIAMDAKTGDIVFQRNQNQPRKVASVAKTMALYLVEKYVHQHGDNWNTRVPYANDRNLRKMSYDYKLGSFKFKKHHRYTVGELFKAALIQSSNNSTIALADWVAGNNANFVKLMNQQARAWDIDAHFVSPSGLETSDLNKYHLNVSKNPNSANLLSAKAVAIIAQHLIKDYPSVTNLSKLPSATDDGQSLSNANDLLSGESPKPKARVFGLKTGFTPKAGYCFVCTSQKKGHDPLITVVLHDNSEFNDTKSLIDYVNNSNKLK